MSLEALPLRLEVAEHVVRRLRFASNIIGQRASELCAASCRHPSSKQKSRPRPGGLSRHAPTFGLIGMRRTPRAVEGRDFASHCDQYIIVLNINTISGSCLPPE
jgi:hypothetical protein